MKKLFTIFLVLIIAFTTVACNIGNNSEGEINNNEVVKTDKYLLKDGRSDYVVVLPNNSNSMENTAAEEFVSIFNESTGYTLQIIKDTGLTFDGTKQYISIGNTTLISLSNLEVPDKAKGVNSYTIKTVDSSIFIVGGSEYGVLYGVYELLYRMLNFEQFYTDCYSLDKAVTDLTLDVYNITHSPSFERRVGFDGFMASNPIVARRMRSPYLYSMNMGTSDIASGGHNTLHYLPPATYGAEYGDYWYDNASNPTQLCWTAHGDPEMYDKMIETFTERVKEVIIENHGSGKYTLYISNMDWFSSCTCKACSDMFKKYKTDAGAYVIFVNKIYDNIMDWMHNDAEGREYYIENFKIRTSAYYKFEKAPAYFDEDQGKWLPIDEDVILRDGVLPGIAPIFTNFTKSIYDEKNKPYLDLMRGWEAVSSNVTWFVYCTNFNAYMYPFENFNYMQEYYQLYADIGAFIFIDETQNGNNGGMTGFHILKSYLSSKLAFDVNADVNELINRFFNVYFGEAAEDMLKFFNSQRAFFQYQQNELGLYTGTKPVQDVVELKEFWPKRIIDAWQGNVKDALDKIEKLKDTDLERYEMLYKHITCERVFLDYVSIKFYDTDIGSDITKYVERHLNDIELNSIHRLSEGRTITSYLTELKGMI